MMRPGRAAQCLLLAACCVTTGSRPVHAQSQAVAQPLMVRWSGQLPLLSFEARDMVNHDFEKKLKSGLPQRIVTRVYAYARGREEPIALSVLSCRVVYDLWGGGFRVERQTEQSDRALAVADTAGVLDTCLKVKELTMGPSTAYQRHKGSRVYFAAIVELNPMSPDTVQRIRRWLSKGSGQLSGDAFFGSFVSIFVSRRLGSAEQTMTFRSRSYEIP